MVALPNDGKTALADPNNKYMPPLKSLGLVDRRDRQSFGIVTVALWIKGVGIDKVGNVERTIVMVLLNIDDRAIHTFLKSAKFVFVLLDFFCVGFLVGAIDVN